jgi:hypothetical protein
MGFSLARLGRMHDVMAGHVERATMPGVVTLVSRRGEVHVDAIGMTALDSGEPMRRDTIFRITSMTKPITAAATMILVEECKLRLDELVDRDDASYCCERNSNSGVIGLTPLSSAAANPKYSVKPKASSQVRSSE